MKPSFWGEGNLAREDGFVVEGGIIGGLRRPYEGIGDHRILWEVLGLIDWNGSVLLGAHFFALDGGAVLCHFYIGSACV